MSEANTTFAGLYVGLFVLKYRVRTNRGTERERDRERERVDKGGCLVPAYIYIYAKVD